MGDIKPAGPGITEKTPLLKLKTNEASTCPYVVLNGFEEFEKVDAVIGGDHSQILEVQVAPTQACIVEPGTFFHMDDGFKSNVTTGGGCMAALKRCCCAGEDFFQVRESELGGN